MTTAVATTTWNSIDLVRTFLVHYRQLGVDQVLVMDFASTDGTRDVLASAEWRGFVDLVPFPGIALLDSSNILLGIARARFAPDDWCLFCDPDELLVTPSMTIDDARRGLAADAGSVVIPRFNLTAQRSVALNAQQRLSALDALTLRVDRRQVRSIDEDIRRERLDPPWIFTAIPGKAFVRLGTALAVEDGDHSANTSGARDAECPAGVYLLHAPLRTYEAFCGKLELARIGFRLNPHLPQVHGWQVRRWIDQLDAGTLHDEYVQQFIPDDQVDRLLLDGTLARDASLVSFHRTASNHEGC